MSSVEPGSPAYHYLLAYAFEADAFGGIGWTTPKIPMVRDSDTIVLCLKSAKTGARHGGHFPAGTLDDPCARYSYFRFAPSGKLFDFDANGVDIRSRVRSWTLLSQMPRGVSPPGFELRLLSAYANPTGRLNLVVALTNNTRKTVSLSFGGQHKPLATYVQGKACLPPGAWAVPPGLPPGSAVRLFFGIPNARFGGTLVLTTDTGARLRLVVAGGEHAASLSPDCLPTVHVGQVD